MLATNQSIPAVIGYVAPLSARPGELLEFKISSVENRDVRTIIVRLDSSDPNPAGPGLKQEVVEFGLHQEYRATEQNVYLGSCAIGRIPIAPKAQDLVVNLIIKPTVRGADAQTIFSLQSENGGTGFSVILKGDDLYLRVLEEPGADQITGIGLKFNHWSNLEVTFADDRIAMSVANLKEKPERVSLSVLGVRNVLNKADHISFAASWAGHPFETFNGSIEEPRLLTRKRLEDSDEGTLHEGWHFGRGSNQWVEGEVTPAHGLQLINLPMRAVRSSKWTGRNMDWKIAPDEYAAITFHSDDLSDCGWDTTITIEVPELMTPGVYGLVADNGIGTDTIPFYVRPGANSFRRKIIFLAPTFTYMAYANHARGNFAGALEERVKEWNAYPHNPDAVGMFGHSTYNRHPDGSGVTLSSRLRPIMNMRPGYLTYCDKSGSGMRGFSADSHLTDWLRVKGFEFDVLTDEDLDREGVDAISPYDVVLTGSHPEYHTRNTLEALLSYREAGGKVMYLGGNGFYWKIGRDPALPHAIEIRRAEGGMRVWASQPGEYYNQLDGEYGGMWRRNGIPPQKVAGVGFTAEGEFEGTYYLRTEESLADDLSFLFDGISADERIGDFGLSGGGAAGFEIDQACYDLGTPDYVRVVAASEGHGPSFETTYEELLLPGVYDGGQRPYGGMRSNIVFGIAENGGALFSVGSITFCGSLSHNGYDNNVSRLLENCLRKFLAGPNV